MSIQAGTFHLPGQRVRVNSNASHYAGLEGVIAARDPATDTAAGAMAAIYHVDLEGHSGRHSAVFWGIELDATGLQQPTDIIPAPVTRPAMNGISVIYFDTLDQAREWRREHGGWVFSAETTTLWFSTDFTPTAIMNHPSTQNLSGRLL